MMGAPLILIVALVGGLMMLAFIFIVDRAGARGHRQQGAKHHSRRSGHVVYVERLDVELVRQRWNEINTSMHSPSGLKQALVEADKLLDYVLKGKGYFGDGMADRLKKAQSHFSRPEAVWSAHKLRNTMVHEINHDLVPAQVRSAVHALGQAIIDLGVNING